MTCDDTTLSLGVYLLGALDADERTVVERHLEDCPQCAAELAELAALPSMLERLTLDDFAVEAPVVPEALFERVAARAREEHADRQALRGHRYRRLTAVAAALVIVAGAGIGSAVVLTGGHHHQAGRTVVATQGHVKMQVTLAAQTTGTSLQVTVAGLPEDQHCTLIAIAKNGERDVAGRWSATYQGRAQQTGSTVIPTSQLARFVLLGNGGRQLVTVHA
jgi:predicted anti-sigma-YlaC factor YlaD